MKLQRYLRPSVLATNISSLCLMIELILLVIVIPVCTFAKSDALIPAVGTAFGATALIGIGCAMIAGFQSQTKTTPS